MKSDVIIEYNGEYPNLCRGTLTVKINGKIYEFPKYCLHSNGSAYFTNDYADSHVTRGDWEITDWPENFPEKWKQVVEEAVNEEVTHGCCGGCL